MCQRPETVPKHGFGRRQSRRERQQSDWGGADPSQDVGKVRVLEEESNSLRPRCRTLPTDIVYICSNGMMLGEKKEIGGSTWETRSCRRGSPEGFELGEPVDLLSQARYAERLKRDLAHPGQADFVVVAVKSGCSYDRSVRRRAHADRRHLWPEKNFCNLILFSRCECTTSVSIQALQACVPGTSKAIGAVTILLPT